MGPTILRLVKNSHSWLCIQKNVCALTKKKGLCAYGSPILRLCFVVLRILVCPPGLQSFRFPMKVPGTLRLFMRISIRPDLFAGCGVATQYLRPSFEKFARAIGRKVM